MTDDNNPKWLSWRNEIIDRYGMTPEEVYAKYDEPDHVRCRWCGTVFFGEQSGDFADCHRLGYGTRCVDCRREHLKALVAKWRIADGKEIA